LYGIRAAEWDMIRDFIRILQVRDVSFYRLNPDCLLRPFEVPHAFQHKLSAEKTPTLGDTLPSYMAMEMRWEALKTELPAYAEAIDDGLEKLEAYRLRTDLVPAYTLAMGMHRRLLPVDSHQLNSHQPGYQVGLA
jgi:hypothetical protein